MITPETLIAFAGVILSLSFFYVPGLKEWYMPLESEKKGALMVVLMFGISVLVYTGSCYVPNSFAWLPECGPNLLVDLITVLWLSVVGLMGNQATYSVHIKPRSHYTEE
jgi:hypothetical protein